MTLHQQNQIEQGLNHISKMGVEEIEKYRVAISTSNAPMKVKTHLYNACTNKLNAIASALVVDGDLDDVG